VDLQIDSIDGLVAQLLRDITSDLGRFASNLTVVSVHRGPPGYSTELTSFSIQRKTGRARSCQFREFYFLANYHDIMNLSYLRPATYIYLPICHRPQSSHRHHRPCIANPCPSSPSHISCHSPFPLSAVVAVLIEPTLNPELHGVSLAQSFISRGSAH
jgi:hypothetical protein